MTDEIKDPQEEPTPQPVNTDPPEETVGDIMQKMSGEGLKWLVIVLSAAVYVAGIVYAEVHGITMLKKGVAPDMQIWAMLGMIAAGVSALLFPVALQVWAIEARHRLVTILFYAADFAFLAFNAFTDFNTQTGQTLAPWAQNYVTYILPASPIVVAVMWAILWELDPAVLDKIERLTLRMAMKRKMSRQVAEAAKGAHVTARVNAAADREVERALTELFGYPVSKGYVMDTTERTRDSLTARFFGGLLKRVQSLLSLSMPGQSQPSDSDERTPPQV
jgi:hypothetical protein